MKPPSVEKEFTVRILPALAASGFKRAGGKRFARVSADVIQFLFINVRSSSRREFMLEYTSLLAFEPHLQPSLAHGGSFPLGSRSSVWHRADSEESLHRSCDKVSESLPELLQWFDATASLAGFMVSYQARLQHEPPALRHNGHSSFTLACGTAAAGDLTAASDHLQQAVTEFQTTLQDFAAEYPDTADDHWARERLHRCEELATAIREEGLPILISGWREASIATLKLSV